MTDMNDFNKQAIEEFVTNEGKVGGMFDGTPLLLLTVTGAKSGQPHTAPLIYVTDGDRLVIIASKGGAPTHPDWYQNIAANPEVTVELGTERTMPVITLNRVQGGQEVITKGTRASRPIDPHSAQRSIAGNQRTSRKMKKDRE